MQLEVSMMTREEFEDITRRFTYHAPKEGQQEKYNSLRSQALTLAASIMEKTPSSREQSLAITKLEEAVMWANAAIARHE
jgi:hypothetical protein